MIMKTKTYLLSIAFVIFFVSCNSDYESKTDALLEKYTTAITESDELGASALRDSLNLRELSEKQSSRFLNLKESHDKMATKLIAQKQEEERIRREEEQQRQLEENKKRLDKFVGMYQIDWGKARETKEGIEVQADGRCFRFFYSDKVYRYYLGEIDIIGDNIFKINSTDGNYETISIVYFSKGSESEKKGVYSMKPGFSISPYSLVFERVSYGLCVYENLGTYKNKDVGGYYYAKYYKVHYN